MNKNKLFHFWRRQINGKGFTLTEVTVTLSIIGIMTAISVPSYFSWLPRHRLQTSARQIYDDLNLAKIRAINNNTNTCITFNTAAETYNVFIDADGSSSWTTGDTIIKSNVSLESDVDITGANTCGFNNRGLFTAGPGQIDLTNPTNVIMRIGVNTAGGISILMSKDGGLTWT